MNIHLLKDGIISGMILGDGHLNKKQVAIQHCHTLPQIAWLKFKLNLTEQLGYNARLFKLTKKRTNLGICDYCSGTTTGHDLAKFYYYSLEELVHMLNPLGLLIWWLDDGCLTVHQKQNGTVSRFGHLNTQSLDLKENQLVSNILYQKFGIETRIHVDSKSGFATKDQYRIYINATNMRRMIDLVREFIPWLPNDMIYKLNMKYVINRRKDSAEMAKHYNF